MSLNLPQEVKDMITSTGISIEVFETQSRIVVNKMLKKYDMTNPPTVEEMEALLMAIKSVDDITDAIVIVGAVEALWEGEYDEDDLEEVQKLKAALMLLHDKLPPGSIRNPFGI